MTTVVNIKKHGLHDVYIGRPTKWGNPFKIGRDGTREEVLEQYREYFISRPHLLEAAKKELKDKILGCYCKPLPCHGDIIAEIIDGQTPLE